MTTQPEFAKTLLFLWPAMVGKSGAGLMKRLETHPPVAAMTDTDLIGQFVRTRRGPADLRVEVRKFDRAPAEEYVPHWVPARVLPLNASWRALASAVGEVLDDPRFFESCAACGSHFPKAGARPHPYCEECRSLLAEGD